MNSLQDDFAAGVFENFAPPCLTLYQPTHRTHPENQQDRIRFRNLVKSLEESLAQHKTARDAMSLLEPFHRLAADDHFWQHVRDGIAVLSAKDMFRAYRLQRRVPELAIVADSCHTKPLIRIMQSSDRYQALGLSRNGVRLFEGTRDVIDEIEPAPAVLEAIADALNREGVEHLTVASYGGAGAGQHAMFHGHGGRDAAIDAEAERVFRAIDRTVQEHHSQRSGMPLVLVTLPEHRALFRRISRNTALLSEGVDVHPESVTPEQLRERIWKVLEPHYYERIDTLAEGFVVARSHGLASEELPDVARALAESKVATLLIEDDRQIPGRVDGTSGTITFGDLADPRVDDLLDDLGALALRQGARVFVIPADRMPTRTGAAAVHRY